MFIDELKNASNSKNRIEELKKEREPLIKEVLTKYVDFYYKQIKENCLNKAKKGEFEEQGEKKFINDRCHLRFVRDWNESHPGYIPQKLNEIEDKLKEYGDESRFCYFKESRGFRLGVRFDIGEKITKIKKANKGLFSPKDKYEYQIVTPKLSNECFFFMSQLLEKLKRDGIVITKIEIDSLVFNADLTCDKNLEVCISKNGEELLSFINGKQVNGLKRLKHLYKHISDDSDASHIDMTVYYQVEF